MSDKISRGYKLTESKSVLLSTETGPVHYTVTRERIRKIEKAIWEELMKKAELASEVGENK